MFFGGFRVIRFGRKYIGRNSPAPYGVKIEIGPRGGQYYETGTRKKAEPKKKAQPKRAEQKKKAQPKRAEPKKKAQPKRAELKKKAQLKKAELKKKAQLKKAEQKKKAQLKKAEQKKKAQLRKAEQKKKARLKKARMKKKAELRKAVAEKRARILRNARLEKSQGRARNKPRKRAGKPTTGEPPASARSDPPSHAEISNSIIHEFNKLLVEDYSHTRQVPIHEVRRRIAEIYGPEAASHARFDKLCHELWRDKRIHMVPITLTSSASEQQLNDSIRGVGETFFYLESKDDQPILI